MQSAQAQVLGLYQPAITQDSFYYPPLKEFSFINETKESIKFPSVPIIIDVSTIDPMLLSQDYCLGYTLHIKYQKENKNI